MFSYANGKFVLTEELALPIKEDITGTIRGFRIFTACRTLPNGKVFRLEDHIDRLFNFATAIYMELPHDKNELKEVIQETIVKNKEEGEENRFSSSPFAAAREGKELLLEIIYSGGRANLSGVAPAGKAILYIMVLPLKMPPARWYEKGIKLAVYPYQRQWPEIKFLNYVGAVIAHQTVVKKYEADDALFVSPHEKKIILEGTTFNFFIIKNGVIVTHPADGKILPGITRKVALELACQQGIKTKEDYFSLDDLLEVEEAFITSSTRNIVPVVRVDDIVIGSGQPGEITNKLARFFKEYQANY
ncbi:MAG: aminotransferase class IV [bacterium]|nr:aminotransferase class IV [bacterium]